MFNFVGVKEGQKSPFVREGMDSPLIKTFLSALSDNFS